MTLFGNNDRLASKPQAPAPLPSLSGSQLALLENINKLMAEIGSTAKWKTVPDQIPGCEGLLNKRVLVVDDGRELLELIMRQLVVETGGNADCILHTPLQSMTQLVAAIIAKSPQVVLLDYGLANGIKGTDLAQELMSRGVSIKIIGFSSESDKLQAFKRVGFDAVEKDAADLESTLCAVATIVAAGIGGQGEEANELASRNDALGSDVSADAQIDPLVPPTTSPASELLGAINKAMARLGSPSIWTAAPERINGCEEFLNRRIVVVDRAPEALEKIMPQLIVDSGGTADFVLHSAGQSLTQLTAAIIEKLPQLVLLDWELAGEMKAPVLVRELSRHSRCKIVGFTSDWQNGFQFEALGIDFVVNRASHPRSALCEIARMLAADLASKPPTASPYTDHDGQAAVVYYLSGRWVVVTQEAPSGEKTHFVARHQGIGLGSLCLYPLHVCDADPIEAAHIPTAGWTANGPLSRGQIALHRTGPLMRDDEGNTYTLKPLPEELIPVADLCSKNSAEENLGEGPRTQWVAARKF